MEREHDQRGTWLLRVAVFLLVLGTAKYFDRDVFHADDSSPQGVIELSSVALAFGAAMWAMLRRKARLAFRLPYVLFLLSLVLAVASSIRSWDPLFSATKGVLLILTSVAVLALISSHGVLPVLRNMISAYVVLIAAGILVGLLMPDQYPLILHDPGEESLRARLHLFRIHPIAVADACVICLITSIVLSGTWIRVCRVVLVTCLAMTVARASIIVGVPLYIIGEFLSERSLAGGFRRVGALAALGGLAFTAIVGVVLLDTGWRGLDTGYEAVVRITEATTDNTTLSGRTTLWGILLADLSFDNVYGYGVGGARYYLRTVNPWFTHSHNSALETIYTSGYLGLTAMIGAFGSALFSCFQSWRSPRVRVLTTAGLYVIAVGMMNPSWYDTSSVVVISILCGLRLMPAQDPKLAPARSRYGYATGFAN